MMLALPDLERLRVKPDPIFEEVAQEKQKADRGRSCSGRFSKRLKNGFFDIW